MDEREREQLRRLAGWLAARRDVDEAVSRLTQYGPAAAAQINTHLSALRHLLSVEADAFTKVESVATPVAQRPLPVDEPLRATVHPISAARQRRDYA